MPFGLATSPRLFQTWADCIKFIVEESNPELFNVNGLKILTHYLDDFWAGHPDFDEATRQFYKLFHLLEVLGIPTSEDKCTKPTTQLTIIGFLLNTLTQCVSIPSEKIKQYLQDIDFLLKYPYKCTIKKLEKIIGKLRHCARVMYGGASFVRGLESRKYMMQYIKNKTDHHPFNLGTRAKYDLEFWRETLPKLNYSTPFWYILNEKYDPDFTIYTDAAENDEIKAYGGISSHGTWFVQDYFDTDMVKLIQTGTKLINFFELIAVVVALELNKDTFKGKLIHIRCDNKCALSWILTQRASFDTILEKYVNIVLKYLYKFLISNKIYITGKYIASDDNTYADALSRLDPYPFAEVQEDIPYWKPNKRPLNPNYIVNNIFKCIEEELNIKL